MKPLIRIRLCLFVLAGLFLTLQHGMAQTRIDMPDGESTIAVNIINLGSPATNAVRLTATKGLVYSNSYNAGLWTKNKALYEVPYNRRIVDAALKFGELGTTRTYGVLLDNGDVIIFTYDTKTDSFSGSPEYVATPFTPQGFNQQSYKKILLSSAIKVHYGNSIFSNLRDGNGYTLDSTGLSRGNVQDVTLDNQANLLAATNRGVYSWNALTSKWQRLSGFDSSLSASSIYCCRDGRLFASTGNRGTFVSADNGAVWQRDTVGLNGASLVRFADDLSNNVYASSNPSNSTSNLFVKMGTASGWTRIDSSLSTVAGGVLRINDMAADQTLELAVNIGTMSSKKQGSDWSNTTIGIAAEDIYGIQFLSGGISVVSTSIGIFRKNTTWSQVFPATGFNGARPLYRGDSPSTLCFQLAGTGQGATAVPGLIYSSGDAGATWTLDTAGLSNVPGSSGNGIGPAFGLDMKAKKYIGVGSPIGVYTSPSWMLDTAGFNSPTGTGTAASFMFYSDPANTTYLSGGIYVGGGGGGFVIKDIVLNRRTDGSATWASDTNGLNKSPITSITSGKPGTYAGSGLVNGVSLLYKRGTSGWQNIPAPPTAVSDARALAIDSTNALFVAYTATISNNAPNRGVYATGDNGATWDYAGLDSVTVRGLQASSDGMYAYTSRGTFKLSRSPLRSASIQFNKHVIDFGTVDVGSKKDTTITINNSGNDTLRVSNMRTNSASFISTPNTFTVAPGASKDVVISFQPTVGGALATTLRSVANTAPDTIYLSGRGKAADVKIVLESRDIDMGVVDVGVTKDSLITVGNSGGDTLKVSNVTFSNPALNFTPKTFKINPRDSQQVTIRFAPTGVGSVIAFMKFVSNGPADSIRILGRGEIASVDDPSLINELKLSLQPNPVLGESATLRFELPASDQVEITVLDENGQLQHQILNARMDAGLNIISLADFVRSANSGMYFIRISTAQGNATMKCVVTK